MSSFRKQIAIFLVFVIVFAFFLPVDISARMKTSLSGEMIAATLVGANGFRPVTPATTTPSAIRVFAGVYGTDYTEGEIVYYNGSLWVTLQTIRHWADPLWRPGIAHSLWAFVTHGSSMPQSPPPTGNSRPFIDRSGEIYHKGELISHNGRIYRVRQLFIFWGDLSWFPGESAHSLWEFVGMASGGPIGSRMH